MGSAGIVANHAPQSTLAVGGWIGSKGEMILLCRVAQMIENKARLNPRQSFFWINLDDVVQIL